MRKPQAGDKIVFTGDTNVFDDVVSNKPYELYQHVEGYLGYDDDNGDARVFYWTSGEYGWTPSMCSWEYDDSSKSNRVMIDAEELLDMIVTTSRTGGISVQAITTHLQGYIKGIRRRNKMKEYIVNGEVKELRELTILGDSEGGITKGSKVLVDGTGDYDSIFVKETDIFKRDWVLTDIDGENYVELANFVVEPIFKEEV